MFAICLLVPIQLEVVRFAYGGDRGADAKEARVAANQWPNIARRFPRLKKHAP